MISVAEAKNRIQENIKPLAVIRVSLKHAAGLILAEEVLASIDIPPFNQSSLDGYAFKYDDWKKQESLTIKGEIQAGSISEDSNSPRHAIRIFTGAPIPDGADTVVMQEKTKVSSGQLIIEDLQLAKGNAFRSKGSEIKAGQRALEKGSYLSPAAIGFLASIGIAEVSVYGIPSISIIVTGNELQQPGKTLVPGQIYESNSFALVAALNQMNITDTNIFWVNDHLDNLKIILESALTNSDLVILTGGISVGDYDFVLEAATKCGVSNLFHGIKQRPGKPLYFGKKGNQYVFGLPGNPSSVLCCFYEYVLPAIALLTPSIKGLKYLMIPLAKPTRKAAGFTHFLKGYYDGIAVTPLDAQESYRLSSFAKANCLICLHEETTDLKEGDLVEIHLLPY